VHATYDGTRVGKISADELEVLQTMVPEPLLACDVRTATVAE
jgi:hypothetical protein